MKKRLSYLFILLSVAGLSQLFFPRCANIAPPTGGPRDTIPPEVVSSNPPNYSTRFTGTEIQITFDEFIELRGINQQFIITPPQRERPDFRARGRNLSIDLKNEPIPNTTYTLNFGEAIVDLNEGNPLSNYEFVFSTGDKIDSLGYSGMVLNAADNSPVKGAIVMLYDELNDSVPYRKIPLYATRTGEDGSFYMNNLRSDTFLVFAITDVNNNYLYDRPGEEAIAFLDDHLYLTPDKYYFDSGNDTVEQIRPSDTLYLFVEETGRQYLRVNERPRRGELRFVFNLPLEKEWSIDPVNFDPEEEWIMEVSPRSDTIIYWIADRETREIDNMRFLVSYLATGPSDSLQRIADTINMNYTAPVRSRIQNAEEETDPAMDVVIRLPSDRQQDLHRDLGLTFPAPLQDIDPDKSTLLTVQNDQTVTRNYELIQDSIRLRHYKIVTEWIPGQNYRFTSEPGAFTDIFGNMSDSIEISFTTKPRDHYGSIILNLTGVTGHIILHLLDTGGQILREYNTHEDGEVTIEFLEPGQFRLKAIFDANNNGKWDTGNYLEGIQPEKVLFFEEIITTRSNWDIEVEWDLNK